VAIQKGGFGFCSKAASEEKRDFFQERKRGEGEKDLTASTQGASEKERRGGFSSHIDGRGTLYVFSFKRGRGSAAPGKKGGRICL